MNVGKRFTLRRIVLSFSSLLLVIASTQAQAFSASTNFGAGFGIPYGMFGVNLGVELNVADSFAIIPNVGVGTTILAGVATNIGLRVLFGDKDDLFRFGIGYWSGTNTVVETSRSFFGTDSDYETESGITQGLNFRFQFGKSRKHGLDVGVLRIITPTEDEIRQKYLVGEKQGSDTKVSVGYLLRF